MTVGRLLTSIAIAVVVLSTLFAALGLASELMSGSPVDVLIRNLGSWAAETGYRLILTVLAAAGVYFLANKK